jgi:uncharacterized coiled-coil DUF342 family protein
MDKRMTYGGNGSHWEGCAKVHWDCKIAQLEKDNADLRERLDDYIKRLEDANNEIAYLKDIHQDPFDTIEVLQAQVKTLVELVKESNYKNLSDNKGE